MILIDGLLGTRLPIHKENKERSKVEGFKSLCPGIMILTSRLQKPL